MLRGRPLRLCSRAKVLRKPHLTLQLGAQVHLRLVEACELESRW
ncbi:hypothetical protein [Corallococcus exercitus]|nr:hypothetical protein [Corallococcus exercitus]